MEAQAGPSSAGHQILNAALTRKLKTTHELQVAATEETSSTNNEHYTERVRDRRLQLANPDRRRPRAESTSNAARKLKSRTKRCDTRQANTAPNPTPPRALSKSARRHRGLDGLDPHTSYTALLPLHELWTSYIQQFLSLLKLDEHGTLSPNTQVLTRNPIALTSAGTAHIQAQICKADLLASSISVTRCANPSLVGMRGLVAKETQGTFVLATQGDKFKVVPKRNTTFEVRVKMPSGGGDDTTDGGDTAQISIPLHGNQLTNNMITRATKKWKVRRTLDY